MCESTINLCNYESDSCSDFNVGINKEDSIKISYNTNNEHKYILNSVSNDKTKIDGQRIGLTIGIPVHNLRLVFE
jgi:hypothetical protein